MAKDKYYFVQYHFVKRPSILEQGNPVLAGETCECIDTHPFEFMEKKISEGFLITLKFFKELTEEEFDSFNEMVKRVSP